MAYEIANIKEHGVRDQQWHGGLLWTEATPCFFVLEIEMPYKPDRTLTIGRKNKILERDNNECQYCYGPGDEVDHIIPWAYEHGNSEENLVCCCWMCNRIASDRVFRSFGQKQRFIIDRRHKFVKANPIPLWLETETDGLGRKLKKDILSGEAVLVFSSIDDLYDCRRRLLNEGWRVVIGSDVREQMMMTPTPLLDAYPLGPRYESGCKKCGSDKVYSKKKRLCLQCYNKIRRGPPRNEKRKIQPQSRHAGA